MGHPFVRGMVLAERLYREGVKPAMAQHFPELRYSAARLRGGSDVLGYDTPRSMDHGWGPMVEVYLAAADCVEYAKQIVEVMRRDLPREVAGVPYRTEVSHMKATDDKSDPLQGPTDRTKEDSEEYRQWNRGELHRQLGILLTHTGEVSAGGTSV